MILAIAPQICSGIAYKVCVPCLLACWSAWRGGYAPSTLPQAAHPRDKVWPPALARTFRASYHGHQLAVLRTLADGPRRAVTETAILPDWIKVGLTDYYLDHLPPAPPEGCGRGGGGGFYHLGLWWSAAPTNALDGIWFVRGNASIISVIVVRHHQPGRMPYLACALWLDIYHYQYIQLHSA